MTVNLCVVSGTLVAPDGSPMPEVQVQFLPAPVTMRGRGTDTVAPRPVQVVSDANAALSIGLAPGVYTLRTREADGREYPPTLVDVPAREAVELADIMVTLPAPQSVYDAAASARAAAKAAGAAEAAAGLISLETEELVTAGNRLFASRTAFETADVPATVQSWSIRHAGRVLVYRSDPEGTAIQSVNGVKGSPAGEPTPLHWGAAPGAPAAVNALAFQAAADYATARRELLTVPAGRFDIAGPILFAPDHVTRTTCGLVGAGIGTTVLVQSNPGQDLLQFIHDDPERQYGICPVVRDLAIEAPGATEADQGAAIRHRETLTGIFEGLDINGPTFAIVSERGSQCWYNKIYVRSSLRASGQRAAAAFVFDHNPVRDTGRSFGNYMNNVEMQAGRGARVGVLMRAVDGLKWSNGHIDHCETHFLIDMDGTGGRTRVREVMVSNVYSDSNATTPTLFGVKVRATGGSCDIRGLTFVGSTFRAEAAEARAFGFDRAAGALNGLEFLDGLTFTACPMVGHSAAPAIDLRGPDGFDHKAKLRNVTITSPQIGNRGSQPARTHGLILAGTGVSVRGGGFAGNWSASGDRAIRVIADADAVAISDVQFDTARVRHDNIEIDAGATNVSVLGVGGTAGASLDRSIVSIGENENGRWERYSDGWQVAWKTITDRGPIETADGNIFRSSTVGLGAWPMPFVEPPFVLLTSFHASAQRSWVSSVASPTATTCGNAVLHRGSPSPSEDYFIVVRGEGRWK